MTDDDLEARVNRVLGEMEKDLTPVIFVSVDGSTCKIDGETNAVTALTGILQAVGQRSGDTVLVWGRSNFLAAARPTMIVEAPNSTAANEILAKWHQRLSSK